MSNNVEKYQFIAKSGEVKHYSFEEILKLVKDHPKDIQDLRGDRVGFNPLQYIVIYGSDKQIKELAVSIANNLKSNSSKKDETLSLFTLQANNGETLIKTLFKKTSIENFSVFFKQFESLTVDVLVNLFSVPLFNNNRLLFHAFWSEEQKKREEIIKIFHSLPEDRRVEILKLENNYRRSVLLELIIDSENVKNIFSVLETSLKNLSSQNKKQVLETINHGEGMSFSLFEKIFKLSVKDHKEYFSKIFSILEGVPYTLYEDWFNNDNGSVIDVCTKNQDCAREILSNSINTSLDAVKNLLSSKTVNGDSFLSFSVSNNGEINPILALLESAYKKYNHGEIELIILEEFYSKHYSQELLIKILSASFSEEKADKLLEHAIKQRYGKSVFSTSPTNEEVEVIKSEYKKLTYRLNETPQEFKHSRKMLENIISNYKHKAEEADKKLVTHFNTSVESLIKDPIFNVSSRADVLAFAAQESSKCIFSECEGQISEKVEGLMEAMSRAIESTAVKYLRLANIYNSFRVNIEEILLILNQFDNDSQKNRLVCDAENINSNDRYIIYDDRYCQLVRSLTENLTKNDNLKFYISLDPKNHLKDVILKLENIPTGMEATIEVMRAYLISSFNNNGSKFFEELKNYEVESLTKAHEVIDLKDSLQRINEISCAPGGEVAVLCYEGDLTI